MREEFEKEYQAWKKDTLLCNTRKQMVENEHFGNIVKMGESIVPFIIEKLKEGPNHIYLALHKIYPNVDLPFERTKIGPFLGIDVKNEGDLWVKYIEENEG